ncbi:MAG: response regulator [Patescibacteria group bacterium]
MDQQLKILIIDDYENSRVVLSILLGHFLSPLVDITSDSSLPTQVFKLLEENKPDLLIVSIAALRLDSDLKNVSKIRELYENMPIVALSTLASKEECLTAGATDYFTKPTDNLISKLVEKIKTFIKTNVWPT